MASPDKRKEFVVFLQDNQKFITRVVQIKVPVSSPPFPSLSPNNHGSYVITNASLIAKLCFAKFGLEI